MYDPEMYVREVPSVVVDITNLLKRISGRFKWSEKEMILDVGCGPGNTAKTALFPILPEDAILTGLDISEEMVHYANENNSSKRISYKVQDISVCLSTSTHWKPETFDKIFSFYCLHLVPNLELTARNLYYLMKPGGYLTTHFCLTSPFSTVIHTLAKHIKWKHYIKNVGEMNICSMLSADDPCAYFSNFLKDAGFQEVSCQTENFTFKFRNMDEVLRLSKSVTPFLKELPKSLLDEFLDEATKVLKQINEVRMSDTGEVSVTWLNMITTARKH